MALTGVGSRAPLIRLRRDLCEFLQAKQAKPLVCAKHRLCDGKDAQQSVVLQQLDALDHLVLRFDLLLS